MLTNLKINTNYAWYENGSISIFFDYEKKIKFSLTLNEKLRNTPQYKAVNI
jgi:hypothetical protein